MRELVWSDVHNRIDLLLQFLEKNKFDKITFLGDWFDSWEDSPEMATYTATQLRKLLERPECTFLFGNHDAYYAFGNRALIASGYSREKDVAISKVLNWNDHWPKFRMFEYSQGYLMSHAGFNPQSFSFLNDFKNSPKETLEILEKEQHNIIECAKQNIFNRGLAIGYDRGGSSAVGGCLWQDISSFEDIDGLPQIVGHSIVQEPAYMYFHPRQQRMIRVLQSVYKRAKPKGKPQLNYGVDTCNIYFTVIEDGKVSFHFVKDFL